GRFYVVFVLHSPLALALGNCFSSTSRLFLAMKDARSKSLHWRAPTWMFAALLVGVLFALGHHIFNSSLDGTPTAAPNVNFGAFNVSQQALNLAGGTAFAFLVRAFLAYAAAIAWTQVFWQLLRHTEVSLAGLDALSSPLFSDLSLEALKTWATHPLLLMLAFITLLLPLPSIVSPASLTVRADQVMPIPSQQMNTPAADFKSFKMFSGLATRWVDPETGLIHGDYEGPEDIVRRVTNYVLSSGQMIPFSGFPPNASWTTTFDGPYLQCDAGNETWTRQIATNIGSATLNGVTNGNVSTVPCSTPNFVAWTPQRNSILPYNMTVLLNSTGYDPNMCQPSNQTLGPLPKQKVINVDGVDPDITMIPDETDDLGPATLFVAALSLLTDGSSAASIPNANNTLLRCQLYNTTYHLNTTIINGEQRVNITFPSVNQKLPVPATPGFIIGNDAQCPYDSNQTSETSDTFSKPCPPTAASTLQQLSFQAIMDAFGSVLVGFQTSSSYGNELRSYLGSVNNIYTTILADTYQIANGAAQANTGFDPGFFPQEESLFQTPEVQDRPRMKEVLELLFQNITVSLMTARELQPNTSSPYAPPLTEVFFPIYHNVYNYNPAELWLAYGLAIFFTLIAVMVGLLAMLGSGMSYSYQFSTIVRAAAHMKVNEVVTAEKDGLGSDPLPAELKGVKVALDRDGIIRRRTELMEMKGYKEVPKEEAERG
ncbi:hypothetical protein HII31_09343, partial [Pseudocercospora fuligena]